MTAALATVTPADDIMERLGRVALATQGVLYAVMGLLAFSLANGNLAAEPSQRGAIESVARQPFGRALVLALAVGFVVHALWRLALAARGEPGDGDDGASLAKRAANVGRAAVYAGLTVAALRTLVHASQGGDAHRRSTATVLGWPGGAWLVVVVGLAVIGSGLWNISKIGTARFLDNLDLSGLDEPQRRLVDLTGRIGYAARGVAFALVGWFLVEAGFHHDPNESKGLDDALRQLLLTERGPVMLVALAAGLVLFGGYRLLDARFRKPSEITHS